MWGHRVRSSRLEVTGQELIFEAWLSEFLHEGCELRDLRAKQVSKIPSDQSSSLGVTILEYVIMLAILIAVVVVVRANLQSSANDRLDSATGTAATALPCGSGLSAAECL